MGVPAARARTALSGPVWWSGATTRCRPRPTNRFTRVASTNSAHEARGGNTFGGRWVALGVPVVPEVNSRFGTIGTSSGGGPAGAEASQSSQSASSHDRTSQSPARAAASRARSAVAGPAMTSRTSPVASW